MKGRYYTTISSASHGYQYTQHRTLVPHFEAGDMRIPNLAQNPRGVPFTGDICPTLEEWPHVGQRSGP